jgi:HEAT repeat protein
MINPMDQPMDERLARTKSARIPPIAAVALIALILTGLLLFGTETRRNHQKQTAPVNQPKIAAVGSAQLDTRDSLGIEETSRLHDLAASVLIPGSNRSTPGEANLQLLAAQLLDESRPLKLRRQAAWNLAKLRSPEAFAVLRQCLTTAPIQLKATIVEALGNFDTGESRELLRLLLKSNDDAVARGAMRGWATLGDSEALQLLSKMLSDQRKSDELRTEAALSLSKIHSVQAYQILVDGLNKFTDSDLATTILAGLGQRSFAETEPFFRNYLSRLDVPTELRLAALESLGQVDGNPVPLLLQHLDSHDSRIRAASAWALAMAENPPDVARQLFKRLESEGNAEVRMRLYQAMENQSNVDSKNLLSVVLDDQAVLSRVAGLKLLAAEVSRQNSQWLTAEFDSVAVTQLEKLAISGAELQDRLISVMALKQAKTPAALQALERISVQSSEPRIIAAARVK